MLRPMKWAKGMSVVENEECRREGAVLEGNADITSRTSSTLASNFRP